MTSSGTDPTTAATATTTGGEAQGSSGLPETMVAAVLHDVGDMRIEEVAVPSVGPTDVLVEVKACGICGTDPHILSGRFPVRSLPLVPGHEFAGVVARRGSSVRGIEPGDKVTADINISCGRCYYCRTGTRLFCPELTQVGVHENGAFAEYVRVPAANIYKLSAQLSFEQGAYVEPLACVIHGQERMRMDVGRTIAIIGAGPMGLAHAMLARLRGAATIIVSEINPMRLAKAREVGVDLVIDAGATDPIDAVLGATEGRGADYVVEAVGSAATYEQAFRMVRPGGVLTAYGAAPADAVIELRPFEIYSKELTIVGSYAGTYGTWLQAIALIESGRFDPSKIVSRRVPLSDVVDAVAAGEHDKSIIKTVVNVR